MTTEIKHINRTCHFVTTVELNLIDGEWSFLINEYGVDRVINASYKITTYEVEGFQGDEKSALMATFSAVVDKLLEEKNAYLKNKNTILKTTS